MTDQGNGDYLVVDGGAAGCIVARRLLRQLERPHQLGLGKSNRDSDRRAPGIPAAIKSPPRQSLPLP
ncbi:MAG: hypothetical protein GY802_26890 [Gammaproteobacteria bacterium]|nr:hypothetical protein [Gammaproteobacteria bacterium]